MDVTRASRDEGSPSRNSTTGLSMPGSPPNLTTIATGDEATSAHPRDSQRVAGDGGSGADDPHREAKVEASGRASSSRPPREDDPACPSSPRSDHHPASGTPSHSGLLLAIRQILRDEVGPIVREEIARFQKNQGAEHVQQQQQQQQQREQLLVAPTWDPKPAVDAPTTTGPLARQAITEDGEDSHPPATSPKQLTVRFSEPSHDDRRKETRQPSSTSRARVELSVVDQKWGVLFDRKGQPTPRLEQVLKGLANYIIEEFMPRKSIVVTPEKLVHLYKFPRVDREEYPWAQLFESKVKGFNSMLADLYDELGCEYHLIPGGGTTRSRPPQVPGLTPRGFASWMTLNLLAYPDAEARRMERIASAFPVDADNPLDGAPERLPKQLSRHLFPDRPDKTARGNLDHAMKHFTAELAYRPPPPPPPPPLKSRRESAPASRDRRSSTTTTTTTQSGPLASYGPYPDDNDDAAASYERERRYSTRRESYNRPYDPRPPSSPSSPTTKRPSISGSIATNTLPPPPGPPSQTSTLASDMPRPPIGRQPGPPKRARSPQRQDYRHSLPQIHNPYNHNRYHHPPPPHSPSLLLSVVADPTFEMPSAHSRELRDKAEPPYRLYAGRDAARAATPDGAPGAPSSPLTATANAPTVALDMETWADYRALRPGGGTRSGGHPPSQGG